MTRLEWRRPARSVETGVLEAMVMFVCVAGVDGSAGLYRGFSVCIGVIVSCGVPDLLMSVRRCIHVNTNAFSSRCVYSYTCKR